MKFIATPLAGVFVVEPELITDERGFFARTVCREEFAHHGGSANFVQQSISFNRRRGTLRGLHYQAAPYEEEKLVRVTAGAIFDVVVDLRADSPARGHWFGIELSARNRQALYIPKGVAHGFQTLTDEAEVLYQMTVAFHPESARGIIWNDPTLKVAWPAAADAILSEKDRALPCWTPNDRN